MEFYIKITQKKQTTRVVCNSHAGAAILVEKFTAKATEHKLAVDPRVYDYPNDQRSAGEVRSAMRLLNLLV